MPHYGYEMTRLLEKHYCPRPLHEIYRHRWLLEFGFSTKEIEYAAKSAARERKARQKSIRWIKFQDRIREEFIYFASLSGAMKVRKIASVADNYIEKE